MLLTGCIGTMVPKTEIKGAIGGQPFSLTSPKDSELLGLEIKADTNGTVAIKIQSLKATMNPAIITTTAEGQALLIKTGIDAGAAIAGKVAVGAAGKP
jgi:hypothetical protein